MMVRMRIRQLECECLEENRLRGFGVLADAISFVNFEPVDILHGAAARPSNLQRRDSSGVANPDFLSERIAPEAAAGSHRAIDGTFTLRALYRQFETRSN